LSGIKSGATATLLQAVTKRFRSDANRLHEAGKVATVPASRRAEAGATPMNLSESPTVARPAQHAYAPILTGSAPNLLDIDALRRVLPVVRRKVVAGQTLFRAGQPFRALYLVHAGFFKTCITAEDGRERVTGFPIRGDLLGIESIGTETFACDVIALDSGEVWELPYPPVLHASHQLPDLQARLSNALATALRAERSWTLALGTLGAEARVALFLLDISARQKAAGCSGRSLVLRMSRAEIGSFLGLQLETVARGLSHLAARGVIAVQRRNIELLDLDRLQDLAGRSAKAH
jgi:CRP/FNR family transcriptional regulator, anaerobic regulatory protein